MRGKSHINLGNYLLTHYLPDVPNHYKQAFLLGCIEPDRNPLTYLKGSLRCQWLRGHNYRNARRFMRKISMRLENQKHWNLFDYYTLGKLIHYTADAFTYAHNETFPTALTDHREYEVRFQHYFLKYLDTDPAVETPNANTIMDVIGICHRKYSTIPSNIRRDSRYVLQASCCVLAVLLTPRLF